MRLIKSKTSNTLKNTITEDTIGKYIYFIEYWYRDIKGILTRKRLFVIKINKYYL